MVIDFHTHIFPDQIAGNTIELLEEKGNIKAYSDGKLLGLKQSMEESGIDLSVVLPVVTKPSQFNSINQFAAQITGKEGIISFGGIHPDCEDCEAKLEEIKRLGLLGIKLHPDYQQTYIDDPNMVCIINAALRLGLIVVIHGGLDIGLPNPIHCTPKKAASMLSQIDTDNSKIILAHMGGYDMWEDVEEYLVGKNIYLDTSYSLGKIPKEQFVRIVKNHGADRILFATDTPWGGQKETLEQIRELDFTKEELDCILYKNGLGLLGLKATDN